MFPEVGFDFDEAHCPRLLGHPGAVQPDPGLCQAGDDAGRGGDGGSHDSAPLLRSCGTKALSRAWACTSAFSPSAVTW